MVLVASLLVFEVTEEHTVPAHCHWNKNADFVTMLYLAWNLCRPIFTACHRVDNPLFSTVFIVLLANSLQLQFTRWQ